MLQPIMGSMVIALLLLMPATQLHAQNSKPLQHPDYTINKLENTITLTFSTESKITVKDFFQALGKELGMSKDDNFLLNNQSKGRNNYTHYNYFQYYKGVRVEGGQFILHEQNGKLKTASGKFHAGLIINTIPAITKQTAIDASQRTVGAKKYLWEDSTLEKSLKRERKNQSASYYPKPELLITRAGDDLNPGNFRLVIKVPIAATTPIIDVDVYVDAQSGRVLKTVNNIRHSNDPSQGVTLYSGARPFISDRFNGFYRLQEGGSRTIVTKNMLNGTDPSRAVQITSRFNNTWASGATRMDSLIVIRVNNQWRDLLGEEGGAPDIYFEIADITGTVIYSTQNNIMRNVTSFPLKFNFDSIRLIHRSAYLIRLYDDDPIFDDLLGSFQFERVNNRTTLTNAGSAIDLYGLPSTTGAVDVQWGLEQSYQYFSTRHGWDSYDDNNSDVNAFVHVHKSGIPGNTSPNNAFWHPTLRTLNFMDGDGMDKGPWTALDICAHEFTHGVAQFGNAAGFGSHLESRALGESFSDIFAKIIEFSAPGYGWDWTFAERIFLPGGPSAFKYERSLKDPNHKHHPQAYGGQYWSATDYHANAGVQNKWFYLLVNGENGTVEGTANNYNVPSLLIDNVMKICFENLVHQLPHDALYKDAYLGSLNATEQEGFANPAREYRAVREAWYALKVAQRPVINSFTPTHGPIGTTVTINGSNFDGVSYVGFNGVYVAAPDIIVNGNYTSIQVKVPSGATTGPVSIIAGYDTVTTTNDFTIDCTAPLTVNVFSNNATSFAATVTGGTAPYTYSLDNVNFQASNVFTGLTSGRNYTVYAKDAGECKGQVTFFLSNPINCNVQSGSGGQGTSFITQNLGTNPGSVSVNYQMYSIPDQMEIYYNGALVASTNSLVSGSGTLTFNYTPAPGGPYHCIIRIYAPNSGTAWDFIAFCPVALSPAPGNTVGSRSPGINEAVSGPATLLYPNPTTGNATLRLQLQKGSAMIRLSEISGKQLWQTTVSRSGNVIIPVGARAAGTYIVTVMYDTGEKLSLKLIRSR